LYGYLFGGKVRDFNPFPGQIDIADHATYGFRIGYLITAHIEPEVQWSRSETNLRGGGFVTGSDSALTLDYFLGGITYNFRRDGVRPYASLLVGAARFAPTYTLVPPTAGSDATPKPIGFERGSSTRFTVVLGVGLKSFITPAVGVRIEVHGNASRIGNVGFEPIPCTTFSTSGPGGPVNPKAEACPAKPWLLNGEVSSGLLFAF
jgi:hypothetical protein